MTFNPLILTAALALPLTAAAQTILRGAVMGVNTAPMIVTGIQSPVQTTSINMPTLSPSAVVMSAANAPVAKMLAAVKPAFTTTFILAPKAEARMAAAALAEAAKNPIAASLAANKLYDGLDQREAAAAINLSNEIDHHAPGITLTMYQDLLKSLKPDQHPVTDVRDLKKLGARADLLKRGFKLEPKTGGMIYSLDNRGNGQRATYYINGAVSLVSFTRSAPKDFPRYQTISLEEDGHIFNETVYPSRL